MLCLLATEDLLDSVSREHEVILNDLKRRLASESPQARDAEFQGTHLLWSEGQPLTKGNVAECFGLQDL